MTDAVLPGLTDAGRDNLASFVRMLGLVDGGGALTALGHDVADTDEAPVPEQGVYALYVASHPLLGDRILDARRLGSGRGPRFDDIGPLERSPDRGVLFRSVLDPTQRFVLRDLPTNHGQPGRLVERAGGTCTVRWTLDFAAGADAWRLQGALPDGSGLRALQHEPESHAVDLDELLADWAAGPLRAEGLWDHDAGVLSVPFDDVTGEERASFRRALVLERVEVEGHAWSDVQLEDVPLGPRSQDDALAWGTALLVDRLTEDPRPRTRDGLQALLGTLVDETPLACWPARVPAHDVCLAEVEAADPSREAWWALAAPVDLAPRPVAAAALDALGVR